MEPELIRAFLGWCTLINFAILLWWFGFLTFARDWVLRLHRRWFRLEESTFDAIHYGGMLAFKLAIFFFNIVPYIALRAIASY